MTTATVTFTNSTNLVNATSHGFSNDDGVCFTTTGALPAELKIWTQVYYVINANANDFQVSLTKGGSAVTFTDDGSATTTARSVDIRYVRTSATPNGNGTTNTDSSGDGTHAFQDLADWEAEGVDIGTNGDMMLVLCSTGSGSTADASPEVHITGWTSGVNNQVCIRGQVSTTGKFDTSIYRLTYTANGSYKEMVDTGPNSTGYFIFEDLQAELTINNSARAFNVCFQAAKTGDIIRRCIAHAVFTNDPTNNYGFSLIEGYALLSYDFAGDGTTDANKGFVIGTGTIRNCTAHNCDYAVTSNYASGTCENVIASKPLRDANFGQLGTENSCQEDSAALAWNSASGDGLTQQGLVTFVNEGADDFQPSNTDTKARQKGKHLNSIFDFDLYNNSWEDAGDWDIGAIIAEAAGGGRIMSSLVNYGGLAGHGGLAGKGGGLAGG